MSKKHIPNALTLFRGLASAVIIILFLVPFQEKYVYIYILFALAAVTDFLDGRLARRWKVESDFGIVFDPLFDKLLVLTLILLIYPFRIVWPVFLVLLFIRDLMTDVFRNFLMMRGIQTPAIASAKWKTTMQMVMLNFVLLYLVFPVAPLALFANMAAALATALSLWSGWVYTKKFALYFMHGK